MSDNKSIILSAKDVCKSFGGMRVLNNISIDIKEGTVLALIGENGAGKSTLINIMSGLIQPDEGELFYNGSEISWSTPKKALEKGIAVVHQELTLFKTLSIADNVFAGNDSVIKFGKLDRKEMRKKTIELMEMLGLDLNPNELVSELSMAQQQIVEVVKALAWNPKILILDEATSALDKVQVEKLFSCCRKIVSEGTSVVFVSHRMTEIFDIADEALVIKDGTPVGYYDSLNGVTESDLVNCMVGYEVDQIFPEKNEDSVDDSMLSIENLNTENLTNINIDVRKGEIIGLGGLRGHGQEELLRVLFGIDSIKSGNIVLDGAEYKPTNIEKAIKSGFAYIPPDRKTDGLVLSLPIEENLTISILRNICNKLGRINSNKESEFISTIRDRLNIDQKRWHQMTGHLSGGNQQKIVIGKWLESGFKVLLMDEPTRGVDVATKHEIYVFLRELVSQGVSVILVSTEIMELMGISDRVYIFYEEQIKAELKGEDINEEKVTYAIMGLESE